MTTSFSFKAKQRSYIERKSRKLDIANAFDSISCAYLLEGLQNLDFGTK
jgi:hypothetical protein